MTGDEGRHRSLELGRPPTQVADLGQEHPGELGSDAFQAIESTFDCLELAATDELGDRPTVGSRTTRWAWRRLRARV